MRAISGEGEALVAGQREEQVGRLSKLREEAARGAKKTLFARSGCASGGALW